MSTIHSDTLYGLSDTALGQLIDRIRVRVELLRLEDVSDDALIASEQSIDELLSPSRN